MIRHKNLIMDEIFKVKDIKSNHIKHKNNLAVKKLELKFKYPNGK